MSPAIDLRLLERELGAALLIDAHALLAQLDTTVASVRRIAQHRHGLSVDFLKLFELAFILLTHIQRFGTWRVLLPLRTSSLILHLRRRDIKRPLARLPPPFIR